MLRRKYRRRLVIVRKIYIEVKNLKLKTVMRINLLWMFWYHIYLSYTTEQVLNHELSQKTIVKRRKSTSLD